MDLLNTLRNIRAYMLKKIMIWAVSIEFLGNVLKHQCDEQHRSAQHIAVARLTNRFTPNVTSLHQSSQVIIQANIFFSL